MSKFKRFLCAALAALILFYAPGFAPKAEAVAVVDDAALLSIALLMTTWAGVTFSQNDQAVSAMQNFLSSRSQVATTLTGFVTKSLIEGSKLLLTKDLRLAYLDILPAIRSSFQTPIDSNSGQISGSVPIGVPVSVPIYDSKLNDPSIHPHIFTGNSVVNFTITDSNGLEKNYKVTCPSYYWKVSLSEITDSGQKELYQSTVCSSPFAVEQFFIYFVGSSLRYYLKYHKTTGPNQTESFVDDYTLYTFDDVSSVSATYNVASDSDSISFSKSNIIDGSQVQNTLTSADLPDSAYGDDRDKYLDIGAVSGVVAGGLAGSVLAPGLDPGSINDDLAHVLGGSISIPTPTTPEVTEPGTEATTPDDVPVAVTPEFLGGHFDGLKDLLNALLSHWLSFFVTCKTFFDSILDSLPGLFDAVVQRIDWAIHYLTAWLSEFWAALIQAVTVSIPDFLNSIYEALETFFGVTVPAWITDVKAWALSLPRTITDAIAVALAAAFIPAAGYWDAKLAACMAAFPFFDSIITTGRSLGSFFSGLGSKPPIIYIDLQNSNSFVLGGRQIFMDLSWYSQYKPTVDTILSAFLWLIVLWRLFLALPGILRGAVGLAGNMERVSEHFHHEED